MKKGNNQNQADNVVTGIAIKDLMHDYVDICNRAIEKNTGNFWYDKAIQLNDAIWDKPYFRVSVYDQNPDKILEHFIVHFNTDKSRLSLSETDQEVEFSCKFTLNYLEDVVRTRPDYYIQNPLMLDWKWFTDRVGTGTKSFIQNNKYLSIGLGLITGALLTVFLVRRSKRNDQYNKY
jgi:hypothetical protein